MCKASSIVELNKTTAEPLIILDHSLDYWTEPEYHSEDGRKYIDILGEPFDRALP